MRNSVAAAQGDLCEHDEVTPRTIYRKQGMALRVDAVR
jgi:hypothetical protein